MLVVHIDTCNSPGVITGTTLRTITITIYVCSNSSTFYDKDNTLNTNIKNDKDNIDPFISLQQLVALLYSLEIISSGQVLLDVGEAAVPALLTHVCAEVVGARERHCCGEGGEGDGSPGGVGCHHTRVVIASG